MKYIKDFQRMRVYLLTIIAIGVSIFSGCSEVKHSTVVLGERTNELGELSQQVVLERTVRSKPVLLAPDGPTHSLQYDDKYFLQAKDKTRQAIPMAQQDEFQNCGDFRPVYGSSLWVAAGINPLGNENTGHVAVINGWRLLSHNENDLHIVVFDEKGIVVHRKFNVLPKWESSEDVFGFVNSNRMVVFRAPDGLKVFDVVANTVTNK